MGTKIQLIFKYFSKIELKIKLHICISSTEKGRLERKKDEEGGPEDEETSTM